MEVAVSAQLCPQSPHPTLFQQPHGTGGTGWVTVAGGAQRGHGKALCQRPPYTRGLPEVIPRFQVSEVGLEPTSAVVLPRALPAAHRTPAPISPY